MYLESSATYQNPTQTHLCPFSSILVLIYVLSSSLCHGNHVSSLSLSLFNPFYILIVLLSPHSKNSNSHSSLNKICRWL